MTIDDHHHPDGADEGRALGTDTLGMPAAEMRRLGHRVVDIVVDRLLQRDTEPAVRTGQLRDLLAALDGPLPTAPGDADAAIDLLVSAALSHQQHGDHPRYFARVPGPSSFAGVLGDWLGIGFNTIATSWIGGSGPAALEIVTLRWLRAFLGLPDEGDGILVSGGSIANLTALATASTSHRGIVYLSDQAHASVFRALRLLGYNGGQVRTLVSDDAFRMPVEELARAVAEDERAGRRPGIVVGTAGTTNTGAIDPLDAMADLAGAHDLWLHVDGAYGLAAAACADQQAFFRGVERADSLVVDPHKWLFQPYGLGCVLMKQAGLLEQTFSMTPEYLRDTASHAGEPSFGNLGPELTRRARALKLWMTFQIHGAARMRSAVGHGIALARHAEAVIRREGRGWEIVTPAQLGIVTFAPRDAATAQLEEAAAALAETGLAAVTSTHLKARSALRLCLMNPLTTERDVEKTLAFLFSHGR